MVKRTCKTCRFLERSTQYSWSSGTCHRYAPRAFNDMPFYAYELLRDIAWSLRTMAKMDPPEEHDEVNKEATEGVRTDASWPEVDGDDWCGEWLNRLDEMT